jgi:hypothetical protein
VKTIFGQSLDIFSSSSVIEELATTATSSFIDETVTDEVWSECHYSTNGWVKTKLCDGCTETQDCSESCFFVNFQLRSYFYYLSLMNLSATELQL